MISDIIRYIKIKRLSSGRGHPEYVPIGGSKAYPKPSRRRAAGGAGHLNSASRGGPVLKR